jgi:hypothetical protein
VSDDTDDVREIVEIPGRGKPHPIQAVRRPGKVHGIAIAGMAICSLIGIAATLAFITVGWPGTSGRFLIGVIFLSVVGFFLCASMAVFAAARDTYARPESRRGQGD